VSSPASGIGSAENIWSRVCGEVRAGGRRVQRRVKHLDLLGGVRGDGGVQGRGEGGCCREGLQDDDNECWVWRDRMYSPPVKAAPPYSHSYRPK
jgi:hypothetical protein